MLRFHEALKKRKYRWLFSSGGHRRPGPKGPSKDLIDAIVEFKRRNPRIGCPRIAQEIARTFGIDIDKDVVRRVLAKHYRPGAGTDGPSWLSFIGHMKDSLWSVDLFRCESILLRSHWVMVVMDVFTRRIIGFGVERADLCGASLCRMFNKIIAGKSPPQHLSTDHDPLFRFHRWLANLRILEVEEIKSIPYVPVSHPFVERLIGTIRREFLDHVLNLERSRPGAKAGRVQSLLQRQSRSPVARRPHSGRTLWPAAAYPSSLLPWRTLPRSVPDADRGVIYEFAMDRVISSATVGPRNSRSTGRHVSCRLWPQTFSHTPFRVQSTISLPSCDNVTNSRLVKLRLLIVIKMLARCPVKPFMVAF